MNEALDKILDKMQEYQNLLIASNKTDSKKESKEIEDKLDDIESRFEGGVENIPVTVTLEYETCDPLEYLFSRLRNKVSSRKEGLDRKELKDFLFEYISDSISDERIDDIADFADSYRTVGNIVFGIDEPIKMDFSPYLVYDNE